MTDNLYAVLFSSENVLKFGKSCSDKYGAERGSWYTLAKKLGHSHPYTAAGIVPSGSVIFWEPGDFRDEQFIHAHLAYEFETPFIFEHVRHTRVPEWYDVSWTSRRTIVRTIRAIFAKIPKLLSGSFTGDFKPRRPRP